MSWQESRRAATRQAPDGTRVPVSIVCVFNELSVLASCLSRSIQSGLGNAPDTEFLPIDNRTGRFATAGAALNHGAQIATNAVIAFVHQDVVLHSLPQLERAAGILLAEPTIGIMGAVGVDGRSRVLGRVRDRVVQIGEAADDPRDVETLDEVLLMMTRDQVLREPLSEEPTLAWHAYGVEYSLRMRRQGRRAVALDIPLTHNSLTTNLENLDLAHRLVGREYSDLLPIHTTCGAIHGDDGPGRMHRTLRRREGVSRWVRESIRVRSAAQAVGEKRPVIADIRIVIDEAAEIGGMHAIRVLDVTQAGTVSDSVGGLSRFGRRFDVDSVAPDAAQQLIDARAADELLLISGLTQGSLASLRGLAGQPHVIGYSRDTTLWVLIGVDPEALRPLWPTLRNRPFTGLFLGIRRH